MPIKPGAAGIMTPTTRAEIKITGRWNGIKLPVDDNKKYVPIMPDPQNKSEYKNNQKIRIKLYYVYISYVR